MSKHTTLIQKIKAASPAIKEYQIPILYFVLFAAINIIISLLFILNKISIIVVDEFFSSLSNNQNFFEQIFNGFKGRIPSLIVNCAVDIVQNHPWVSLVAAAIALTVILVIFVKKKNLINKVVITNRISASSVISAVLIGLGLSALFTGVYGLIGQINASIFENLPKDQLLEDYLRFHFSHSYSENLVIRTAAYFLDAIVTKAFSYVPSASVSFITLIICTVIYVLIFCVGTFDHFHEKKSLFLPLLLCALIYALTGGWGNGIIFSLILGFALGLIYMKTNSLLPVTLLSLSSGFFSILGTGLKSLFGEYWHTYQYPFSCRNDSAYHPSFPSYLFVVNGSSAEEHLFKTCSIVYTVLALIIAIPLLVIGIKLLTSLDKNKQDNPAELHDSHNN